ncbi:hypothetical protein GWK47_000649 [Chionoecetes opilio]|uniref:Uncharacterized protein n=1 Tax=Chionoecetes opilio TaxID=41210 RepID=A0A8J4YE56_CHIOP|nr:hypothetical protein GWK47_000649 [Chionoecetes opilio]
MLLPGPTASTAATLPPARDDRSCGNPRGCLREPGQCRAEQPAWTVTSAPATVVTVSTQRATRCPDTLLLPAGPTPCFLSHSYRVVLWWTPAGQSQPHVEGDCMMLVMPARHGTIVTVKAYHHTDGVTCRTTTRHIHATVVGKIYNDALIESPLFMHI